jgi:hypothetical protein
LGNALADRHSLGGQTRDRRLLSRLHKARLGGRRPRAPDPSREPSLRMRAGAHPRSPASLLVAKTASVASRAVSPAFMFAQAWSLRRTRLLLSVTGSPTTGCGAAALVLAISGAPG